MNVSVVIPTYNREETIFRAIESVLNQSYPVYEIIVVDDKSNDRTNEIIKGIKDSRIRYIENNENKGGAYSRNKGIKEAKGDLIAFQDSDDEWMKNKLEIQVNELIKSKADVVCSSYNQITKNQKRLIPNTKINNEEDLFSKLVWGNFIGTPTIIAKKQVLQNEMFDSNMPRFQDWELMLRISKKYKITFINQPLVNAFIQTNSITRNNSNAVKALEIIMQKNGEVFHNNNELSSHYYRLMAKYSSYDQKSQREYYKKAYTYSSENWKLKLEYYLSQFGLFNLLEFFHKLNTKLLSCRR